MKKWLSLGQGQEIHKMSREHLVVPGNKNPKPLTMIGLCHRTKEPGDRAPNGQSWDNLSNKISKLVLDYNPKYKISIHVFIRI